MTKAEREELEVLARELAQHQSINRDRVLEYAQRTFERLEKMSYEHLVHLLASYKLQAHVVKMILREKQ